MKTKIPDFIKRLTQGGQKKFERAAQPLALHKGAMPIVKGDIIKGAYVVASGKLRVVTINENGREALLYTLGTGDTCVLAINALFNSTPYPGNVVAEENTVVYFIPGQAWHALFRTEAEIQSMTLAALSMAVVRLMQALDNVHARSLRERLIEVLRTHADAQGRIAFTQTELAAELGTAREVVARNLAALRRSGKVAGKRGEILLR